MSRRWWGVPTLACGLVVAATTTATAGPPPGETTTTIATTTTTTVEATTTTALATTTTPVEETTTTSVPATPPAPAVTLSLSTTRPARYGTVTATLTGCTPGGVVRLWHFATYTEVPGIVHEGELELYEITDVTCGADGRASASFVAGPPRWEHPTRTLTGGAIAASLGADSTALITEHRFTIAPASGTAPPTTRPAPSGALPATGTDGTAATAIAATIALGAGLSLVLTARRRPLAAGRR